MADIINGLCSVPNIDMLESPKHRQVPLAQDTTHQRQMKRVLSWSRSPRQTGTHWVGSKKVGVLRKPSDTEAGLLGWFSLDDRETTLFLKENAINADFWWTFRSFHFRITQNHNMINTKLVYQLFRCCLLYFKAFESLHSILSTS